MYVYVCMSWYRYVLTCPTPLWYLLALRERPFSSDRRAGRHGFPVRVSHHDRHALLQREGGRPDLLMMRYISVRICRKASSTPVASNADVSVYMYVCMYVCMCKHPYVCTLSMYVCTYKGKRVFLCESHGVLCRHRSLVTQITLHTYIHTYIHLSKINTSDDVYVCMNVCANAHTLIYVSYVYI